MPKRSSTASNSFAAGVTGAHTTGNKRNDEAAEQGMLSASVFEEKKEELFPSETASSVNVSQLPDSNISEKEEIKTEKVKKTSSEPSSAKKAYREKSAEVKQSPGFELKTDDYRLLMEKSGAHGVQQSIYIAREVKEALDATSEKTGIPVSKLINLLLKEGISSRKK